MKSMFFFFLVAIFMSACNDTGVKPTSLSSFNITNAVVSGNTIALNNADNKTVANMSSANFAQIAGQTTIKLNSIADPAYSYYHNTLATVSGSFYSLFIAGADSAHVQSVLVKENYQNYTDSVSGVRFINLSPDSKPISINIAGNTYGSEITNLAYLNYTPFKRYTTNSIGVIYNFEFRDEASGTLITTYSITVPIFHNVTLVLAGPETNPMVISDNDY